MTFAEELMAHSEKIWQNYYSHPFIQEMIDGTLDKDKFCLYLIQDTKYLVDYARAYAHAFIKCKDIDIMKHILQDMGMIHSEEDMMHIQYLKGFGYSEEDALAMPMLPGCRDYVNYMIRTAAEGTMEDGIMGVLPCALSYYFIGRYCLEEAQKRGTYEGNFFIEWIKEYSGEGYKGVYESSCDLCNQISQDATEKEKARYKEIFDESSRFEVGFWDMAYDTPTKGYLR